jgi:hypothetical protein
VAWGGAEFCGVGLVAWGSRPAIGCHLLKRKAENERDNQVQ